MTTPSTSARSAPSKRLSLAIYAVIGVVLILLEPAARLGILAVRAYRMPLSLAQWVFAIAWTAAILYLEGYRAFQKRFAPRVVGRAFELAREPRLVPAILAPFWAMSLFGDVRKRVLVSWSLVFGIVAITFAVRAMSQPWRGLVDGGVALALGWGCVCLLREFVRQRRGGTV